MADSTHSLCVGVCLHELQRLAGLVGEGEAGGDEEQLCELAPHGLRGRHETYLHTELEPTECLDGYTEEGGRERKSRKRRK